MPAGTEGTRMRQGRGYFRNVTLICAYKADGQYGQHGESSSLIRAIKSDAWADLLRR